MNTIKAAAEFRPAGGAWSVLQVVEHLTIAGARSAAGPPKQDFPKN